MRILFSQMPICTSCGSLVSPIRAPPRNIDLEQLNWTWKCQACSYVTSDETNSTSGEELVPSGLANEFATKIASEGEAVVGKVYAPYVLKYLSVLLASMGVKVTYEVAES